MLPFAVERSIRNAGNDPLGGSVSERLEEADKRGSVAPIGILEFDSNLVFFAVHMEPFVLSEADVKHARDVVGIVDCGKQLCRTDGPWEGDCGDPNAPRSTARSWLPSIRSIV